MDKKDKKARLRAWREEERDVARANLPLSDSDMEALFRKLDERLAVVGCDHTRQLTDAWLKDCGCPVERVQRWLDENGGFCDCEVLANSEEVWRAATRRK